MAAAPRTARIQLVHEKGQAGDKLRPQPVTWIEIELLGDGSPSLARSGQVGKDGEPVAAPAGEDYPIVGEKYRVVLPDGNVREGALDADGVARLDGIPRGLCEVGFPELDQDAWEEDAVNET